MLDAEIMRSLTTSTHVSRDWTEGKCRRMQPEISMKVLARKMREEGPLQTILRDTVSFLEQEQEQNPFLEIHDFDPHLIKAAITHFYSLPDILEYTDPELVLNPHISAQLKKNNVVSNALVAAAAVGDIPLMLHLLKLGASPTNGHSFFGSALHGAIQGGHDDAFDLLVTCGADINTQYEDPGFPFEKLYEYSPEKKRTGWRTGDRRAWSTIEDAANAVHPSITKKILESAEDTCSWSACTRRALMIAIRRGHSNVIDVFLEHTSQECVPRLREDILTHACHHGRSSIVEKMLDCGVDPNFQTDRATLYLAAASGDVPTMQLLRNRGATLGRLGGKERYANELIVAAVHEHYEAVDLLLSWGMRISDEQVGAAVARLLRMHQIPAIELLMSRGLDISRAIPFLITRQQYKNGRYIGLQYNPCTVYCYISSPEYTLESSSHVHGPLCLCSDDLEGKFVEASVQVRVLRRRKTVNWRPSEFWE
jgi:ankyrin repeat protein